MANAAATPQLTACPRHQWLCWRLLSAAMVPRQMMSSSGTTGGARSTSNRQGSCSRSAAAALQPCMQQRPWRWCAALKRFGCEWYLPCSCTEWLKGASRSGMAHAGCSQNKFVVENFMHENTLGMAVLQCSLTLNELGYAAACAQCMCTQVLTCWLLGALQTMAESGIHTYLRCSYAGLCGVVLFHLG